MSLALIYLDSMSVYTTTFEADTIVFRVNVNRTKGIATTKIRKYVQPMSLALIYLDSMSVYTTTFEADTIVFRFIVNRRKE